MYNTVWYTIGKLIPSAFQWCLGNCDIVYITRIIDNLTANFQIITVDLPIIILIYTIMKFLKHHWHAEGISSPMMYHTVLHIMMIFYSVCVAHNILLLKKNECVQILLTWFVVVLVPRVSKIYIPFIILLLCDWHRC